MKKNNKKLDNYIKIDKKQKESLAPSSNQAGVKRKVSDLSSFLKKEESISPPTV